MRFSIFRFLVLLAAIAVCWLGIPQSTLAQAQKVHKDEWTQKPRMIRLCVTEVGVDAFKPNLPEVAVGGTQWALGPHMGTWDTNGKCTALVTFGFYLPVGVETKDGLPIAHMRYTEDRGEGPSSARVYAPLSDIKKAANGDYEAFTLVIPQEMFGNKEQNHPCLVWSYTFKKGEPVTGVCQKAYGTMKSVLKRVDR